MTEFELDAGIRDLMEQMPFKDMNEVRFQLYLYREDAMETAPFGEAAIEACRHLLRRRLLCLLHGEKSWA